MKTTAGGGRKSVSKDGGITGFGANLIVIGDLGKPRTFAMTDIAHDDQVDALTQFATYMRRSQEAYLDTTPRHRQARRELPS